MEAKQSSRKRKQRPSNPLTGIFTRSKSQRFFHHRNRSGKFRLDPVRKPHPFSLPPPSLDDSKVPTNRRSTYLNGDDDDEIYHISIKDLRARRVFSQPLVLNVPQPKALGTGGDDACCKDRNPNLESEISDRASDESGVISDGFSTFGENTGISVSVECGSAVEFKDEALRDKNPNLSEKCDSGIDFGDGSSDGGKPKLWVSMKCDADIVVTGKDSNGGNADMTKESIRVSGDEKVRISVCPSDGEQLGHKKAEKFGVGLTCSGSFPGDMSANSSNKDLKSRKVDDCEGLTVENVQTTPPDAVILTRNVMEKGTAASSSPQNHIGPGKEAHTDSKNIIPNLKRNLVLKPCSRSKVFRAPNSFSYRRLLPYLMDLAKDTSSPPKRSTCAKPENGGRAKALVSSFQDSVTESPQPDEKRVTTEPVCTIHEMNAGRREVEEHLLNPDNNAYQASMQTPINCSHGNRRTDLVSIQDQIVTPISSDFQKAGPHDEQMPPDSLEISEDPNMGVESDLAVLSGIPHGSPETSVKDGAVETPHQLSLCADGGCRKSVVEFKAEENSISMFRSFSRIETPVPSSVPVVGPANGILRKNPRGCRGICNCLNCASYRLNAEKAFEFSRSLLLDAEELALDLMEELSKLRCMLQKSVNGAENLATIPVDQVQVQVQEACRRASNVENIASNRLNQMNDDLYVHCRSKPLQRPRVNFSRYVKEKVIWGAKQEN